MRDARSEALRLRQELGYKVIEGDELLRIIQEGKNPFRKFRRHLRAIPRHNQDRFDVHDLIVLWEGLSRSYIYDFVWAKAQAGRIKLIGVERLKIDTKKTDKRSYMRFWISRQDKEKLERELGLPVGGK